ncbi:DUF5994 family protein [Nocardia sp. NPDC001965]
MTPPHEPILLGRPARFSLRDRPPISRGLPIPRRSRTGTVGGAWWPHTDNLVAEIADLQTLLGNRAGSVDRIMYNLDTWQPAPQHTMLGGQSVRLDGYRHLPAHTLCVLGLDRTRLVLLVIPAATATDTARALLSAASRPDNELTADELVAADTRHRLERNRKAALHRWDDEGGHLAQVNPANRHSSIP